MRPVIFLDFDGVITTVRTRFNYFDPVAVHMLQRLCKAADAEIVVSSTWRIGSSRADINVIFCQCGFHHVPWHVEWKTPILHEIRGKEIEAFLIKYPCSKYLILDDDSDFLPEQRPFHVKTDAYNGFLWEHFVRSHEVLGVEVNLI